MVEPSAAGGATTSGQVGADVLDRLADVFLRSLPAPAFDTNCYVLAERPGTECLVVDPGVGVVDRLSEVLSEHGLRPAAVLITHGHVDHVYSVTPVCGRAGGVPALIHADDRYRLRDPLSSVDPVLIAMLERQFGRRASWAEPEDVLEVRDGQVLTLAGLELEVLHAPGHTEGSVMFRLASVPDEAAAGLPHGVPAGDVDPASTLLAGDVLFAGSVGRTDLAGGDPAAMTRSLREKVLPLPDDVLVLPGHGPATSIGRERARNPYLAPLAR